MIISVVKYQPDGRNSTEIILNISWQTQLEHSKPYIFTLKTVNKPPDVFCTHILFASSIILIFGGLFSHRLYRILKVKSNFLRVPTTDFSRRKIRTRRDNPNSSNPRWKARNKPPKIHTKNTHFF